HKVNDYVIYKLTFKNNESKDYIIKGITDNNSNEYVSYEYDQYKNETIKAGETKDILVKVTYVKEVTDASKRDSNGTVKLSFDIEDEDGNAVVSNVDVKTSNPTTNDNVGLYIAIAVVSICLISAIVIKNKKACKLLVMVAIIAPFAAKAAEASFTITIANEVKLHDKILITSEVNGETEEKLVPYNNKLTKPEDPEKPGHDFIGWFVGDEEFDFDQEVTDDIELVAKFEKVEYTVTFDPNGGKMAIESIKVDKGDSFETPRPYIIRNKEFTGWYDAAQGGNKITDKNVEFTPTKSQTLYAHYEDGYEYNYEDVDEDGEFSKGDIAIFGNEKFYVINGDDISGIVLIAAKPIGLDGDVKQVDSNPISIKFAETNYWIGYNSTSPEGFAINELSFDSDNSYDVKRVINVYKKYMSESKPNNLEKYTDQYYEYLSSVYDFDSNFDVLIPTYLDLYNIGCSYTDNNGYECPDFIANSDNFWIGSWIEKAYEFDNEEDNYTDSGIAYTEGSKVKTSSMTDKKYIRPIIIVDAMDLMTDINYN
nr:InlB B-repeat-containing protein [Bacilli bacterium]